MTSYKGILTYSYLRVKKRLQNKSCLVSVYVPFTNQYMTCLKLSIDGKITVCYYKYSILEINGDEKNHIIKSGQTHCKAIVEKTAPQEGKGKIE